MTDERTSTERLVTFTDGVFAVIITIMVLDLRPPAQATLSALRYEERGPAVTETSKRKRTTRMIRELRALGYRVEALNLQTAASM